MLLPRRKQEADAAQEARSRPAELFIPNPKLRLREQLREVMRFLHYSVRTEESYRLWIRRFILLHNKRHPREVGSAEVHAFLTDPATHHRVAVATLAKPPGERAQHDTRGTNLTVWRASLSPLATLEAFEVNGLCRTADTPGCGQVKTGEGTGLHDAA